MPSHDWGCEIQLPGLALGSGCRVGWCWDGEPLPGRWVPILWRDPWESWVPSGTSPVNTCNAPGVGVLALRNGEGWDLGPASFLASSFAPLGPLIAAIFINANLRELAEVSGCRAHVCRSPSPVPQTPAAANGAWAGDADPESRQESHPEDEKLSLVFSKHLLGI